MTRTQAVPEGHARPVLRLVGLSKTFPGTQALKDVSLTIMPGEVHALVGQNGSGKSTLIKTLAGYHRPDPGAEAWLEDEPIDLTNAGDHRHERLRFVHQDLGLILELDVMDNFALHSRFIRTRLGNVSWREHARLARELLSRFDVRLDLRRPLSEATPTQRVVVAIVAALQQWEGGRGVLVLDEPTAVLPPHEVGYLFQIIAEVKSAGTSIIYVSHRLDEIFEVADRVSVLRGGELIATEDARTLTPRGLATLMAGEDVDPEYRAAAPEQGQREVALEATHVHARYLHDAGVVVRRGEIVGLAGLPGSGREELPYALAGALGSAATGRLRVPAIADEPVDLEAAARFRLPLIPADRGGEGIVAELSVRENMTLPLLDRLRSRSGTLDQRRESIFVSGWNARLKVRTAGIDAGVATLSGGNQQKVLIARCLAQDPPILLMCEPTAGVDVHTRIAIYDLIAEQARQGLAVLVSSTDVEDLLAMCTRVLVLRDGVIVRELAHDELTQSSLLHAMEGTEE